MRKMILAFTICLMHISLLSLPAQGADCSGGWKVMPKYSPGHGGPCKLLGLNSRQGVCQPGYAFETLCDDSSGGRYKTCQGARPCSGSQVVAPPPRQDDCTRWDYDYNQPCPPGYINHDCRGNCSSQ